MLFVLQASNQSCIAHELLAFTGTSSAGDAFIDTVLMTLQEEVAASQQAGVQ